MAELETLLDVKEREVLAIWLRLAEYCRRLPTEERRPSSSNSRPWGARRTPWRGGGRAAAGQTEAEVAHHGLEQLRMEQ